MEIETMIANIGGYLGMILGRTDPPSLTARFPRVSSFRSLSDGPGEAGSGRLCLVQQESWLGGSERGGQEV